MKWDRSSRVGFHTVRRLVAHGLPQVYDGPVNALSVPESAEPKGYGTLSPSRDVVNC
jgi:hypothetical protein